MRTLPILLTLLVMALSACSRSENIPEDTPEDVVAYGDWEAPEVDMQNLDFGAIPFPNLSDYGLFTGKIREFHAADRVIGYEPVSALFTDYALKSRFIWMPEGTRATVLDDEEGTMDFPDQTIIVKNFYYPADFRAPTKAIRILETRLMIKRAGVWEAFPYVWDTDQTDAVYKVVGAEIPVKWTDLTGEDQVINYIVPNKAQCKSCHNVGEEMQPIGVKAKYLNFSKGGQEAENQLRMWEGHGFIPPFDNLEAFPKMAAYEDEKEALDARARAYLDINCAHCHRAEGPASTSGLFLTYEEKDPMKLGIFKTPVAAGFGAGSFTYDILPGNSAESILTYRMGTNQVGAAMPEIGRVSVHAEGLALIKAWIDSLSENP
ncbi:SO2930 family diheme c-type cytochrome [Lunatimonas salinarum]|uniref:SO2930 family diheme c-type cytochrome n=1 Tax=Lunatimonas salinarum TaxID=1774590 RepID=UPI001AE055B1|nr:SO2930 family diheme c-type cytochrome [Lunatimonas salinarum]